MNRSVLLERILKLLILMGGLIAIGTAGFCQIENWPIEDSLYMTVITISTVGFGEMGELGPNGRAFTSVLILASIVCMACWTAGITSVIVEGDITGVFRKRKMKKMAKRLKQHVIICGSGVFARSILEMLYGGPHAIVMVDDNPEQTATIHQRFPDVPIIEQSPTDEFALAQANLARAEYVVAATNSDIDNLLISITCKTLSPNLVVYTFSLKGDHSSRMAKVGVDEVICPYVLGGSRIAQLIEKHEQKKKRAPILAEYLTY